jgi:hypothetical protein
MLRFTPMQCKPATRRIKIVATTRYKDFLFNRHHNHRLSMNFLRRLFSAGRQSLAPSTQEDSSEVELHWLSDATVPVPDWEDAWSLAPSRSDDAAQQRFWWSAARTWVNALRMHHGEHYAIESSKSFVLLSTLDPQQRKLLLDYCERARVRILRTLEGVASSWGHGPHVVLVFEDVDAYYEYIGNYYPKSGVFGMSSGMFIQSGYGHFVFVASDMFEMEPIIAHELTHCLLAPLSIPAWLNEGTAVNMEKPKSAPLSGMPRQSRSFGPENHSSVLMRAARCHTSSRRS